MTQSSAALTRSQLVRPALELLRDRGRSPSDWIARYELPRSAEQDRDVFLPLHTLHELLDAIAVELDEPILGLLLISQIRRGNYGLLEYLSMTAPNVEAWLGTVARFTPLINEVTVVSVSRDGEHVIVHHEVPGEPDCLGRHANECWLALVTRALATLMREPVIPVRVWLAHPDPGTRTQLTGVLGVRSIEYGRHSNGFALPVRALATAVSSGDAVLHQILRERAEHELATRGPHARFIGQVRQVLRDQLTQELPTVEATADRLRISTRALQRRLREEATSFQELLAAVRCEIACTLLGGAIKISDVACELQYADESAFVRAFKRWKGVTPGTFRRALHMQRVGDVYSPGATLA